MRRLSEITLLCQVHKKKECLTCLAFLESAGKPKRNLPPLIRSTSHMWRGEGREQKALHQQFMIQGIWQDEGDEGRRKKRKESGDPTDAPGMCVCVCDVCVCA